MKNTAKEVTRQPWKREPPLPAAANWHRHTERILSGKNTHPSEILTRAPTHDSREGGEGARGLKFEKQSKLSSADGQMMPNESTDGEVSFECPQFG